MNSWNPVLNKFMEIKHTFAEKFGQQELFSYEKEKETCLDYWIRRLENPRYAAIFAPLKLTEHENFLQIHYMNYDIYKKDPFADEPDFWKRYDGFYNECRSVVLDIERDCLVLTPFRKFRNLNESEEYSLEAVKERIAKAKTVEVTEKLDGSLQFARYYQGEIVMAGSHSLDCKNSWRLADGRRMLSEKYQKLLRDYAEHTFLFEYVSVKDKHVVSYKKEQEGLYLVGIRETKTGWEWPYREVLLLANKYEIPATELAKLTFEQVLSGLKEKKAEEAEGYVLNIDGFKVKIKFDDFVTAHHAVKDLTAVNSLVQSIAENTFDDLFAKVAPNYKEQVQKNARLVFEYIEKKQKKIKEYVMEGPKADRKEFMLWVAKGVPVELQFYVRSEYKQEPYNVLYAANGKCVKFSDIVSYLERTGEEA